MSFGGIVMEKIDWCLKKKGVELIEPNENLSKSYLEEADKDLETCLSLEGKWKVISGYYACYNALYSLLMKVGIKSEIHDCTIAFMDLFEFEEGFRESIQDLKDKRIRNQYYLQDLGMEDVSRVKLFISECKVVLRNLNYKKVENIRKIVFDKTGENG